MVYPEWKRYWKLQHSIFEIDIDSLWSREDSSIKLTVDTKLNYKNEYTEIGFISVLLIQTYLLNN
jgi:hypothetical protein